MLIVTEILLVFLGLLIILFSWGVFIYSRFIKLRQKVKEAWSDVDTHLKRRYDLVANLIEVVRAYATCEKKVLEKVTQARAAAVNSYDVISRSKAEEALTHSLQSLFAVAENYPQLKASANFQKWQNQLAETENKIQAACYIYNNNVKKYNTYLASFPDLLIAQSFRFQPLSLFTFGNS